MFILIYEKPLLINITNKGKYEERSKKLYLIEVHIKKKLFDLIHL
jgi:hypothetical protein